MKKQILNCLILALSIILCGCGKTNKDKIAPVINSNDFIPENCDIYYQADTIYVHFSCTDNVELGSFNIEIHSNFDHHTHSTEATDCEQENNEHIEEEHSDHEHDLGWVYNEDFAIPEGLTQYTADLQIVVPTEAEEGDYHFMLRLTDKAGWQTIKSVAIKVNTINN